MNQEYDRMSPAQREAARKPLEEIIALARELPGRPVPRKLEDMLPLVKLLRDEKQLSWPDIANWLRDNTEFNRSPSFWSQLHKGKLVQHQTVITLIDPKTFGGDA